MPSGYWGEWLDKSRAGIFSQRLGTSLGGSVRTNECVGCVRYEKASKWCEEEIRVRGNRLIESKLAMLGARLVSSSHIKGWQESDMIPRS